MKRTLLVTLALLATAFVVSAGSAKVVNENPDRLPPGCEELSEEIEITVRGGTEFAREFDGVAFTFEQRSWEVPTCAQVTVTFQNTDAIRHQFMIHGNYPHGMTLIELPGESQGTATWITPAQPTTLMAHCGVNQHQQKGMKAQFLVGGGEGDIPNIPGISGLPEADQADAHTHGHEDPQAPTPTPGPGAALALLGLLSAGMLVHRRRAR